MEAHPGGNPAPGPLDLITGRAELDARIREALFQSTELNVGGEKGARFEFSDGTLEVTKTFRTIKGGRAFRIEAKVREKASWFRPRSIGAPDSASPRRTNEASAATCRPRWSRSRRPAARSGCRPPACPPRSIRAKLVGVENKYFAAIMTREDGAPIEATASATVDEKETTSSSSCRLPSP